MSDINIKLGITADTDNAVKGTKEVQKEFALLKATFEGMQEELKKVEKEFGKNSEQYKVVKKATDDMGDSLKNFNDTQDKSAKTADKTGKSLGGLGTLLKGLGIASVVAGAFDILKDAFMKNQKVADLFATGINFLNRTVNDLVGFLSDNVGNVVEWFKGIFSDPKQAVIDLADAIKNNIIERFNSAIKVAGLFGETLKNVFTGEWKKAGETAKAAGKEMLDVMTGINNTGDKIVQVAEKVVDYTKKTWNASAAQVALQNNAKLAASQLQGLVEEYDRQAENQRQIRDDEFKSIEERIAANEKLGKVLEKQQKAMLALADAKIASAAADLSANQSSIDLQVAYNNSLNERKGIIAQVNGFLSEQKVNATALAKEQIDRDKVISESANKIAFERKKAAAELITDELAKANMLRDIANQEAKIELDRLQNNINNTKAGTQARVDAEIAFNEKKKELDITANATDANIDNIKIQRQKDLTASKFQNENDFLNLKKTLIDAEINDEITKNNKLIEVANLQFTTKQQQLEANRQLEIEAAEKLGLDVTEIRKKYQLQSQANDAEHVNVTKQLSQAIIEAKISEVDTLGGLAKGLSALINQESAAGKVAAIAMATVDTFVAAWRAFTNAQKNPISILGPAYPYIAAASAAAAGIANIKKIAAVQIQGASGGSVPSAGGSVAAPVLPQQTSTQLNASSIQAVGNAAQGGAVRAYMTDADVASSADRAARLNRAARLG